ncbi:MAG: alpha-amylase family protein [Balneolales bacterium]
MHIINSRNIIIFAAVIILSATGYLSCNNRSAEWEPVTEWGHWRLGHRSDIEFLEKNKLTLTFGSGAPNFEGVSREEFEQQSEEAREFNRRYNEMGYIVLRYMTSSMRGETESNTDQPTRDDLDLDFYHNNWHEFEDYIGPRPPESESPDTWVMVHPDGTFPHYRYAPYGRETTGRFEAWGCPNNPYYVRLMEGRMRAQAEVGIDGVYIDWTHISSGTCYCDYCRLAFQQYLNDHVPSEVGLRKYGTANYNNVRLPEEHTEPFWMEFVKFRGYVLSEFHRHLRDVARNYNPNFMVSGNVFGGFGYGPIAYDAASNMELFGRDGYHDFFYSEIQEFLDFAPGKNEEGVKITNSPALKFLTAASQGKPVIVYATEITEPLYPDPTPQVLGAMAQINIAESVSNQATFREKRETPQEATDIYNFLYDHRESLVGAQNINSIAVLASLNQYLAREQSFSFSFSRVLADQGISHVMVVEDDITRGKINQFDVLVLPYIPLLSAELQEGLVDYVENGGRLLILGQSGQKNEFNLPHEEAVFASLFPGNQFPENQYDGTLGAGRLSYIPLVIPENGFLIPPRETGEVTSFGPSMQDVFADTPEGYTRGRIDSELQTVLEQVAEKTVSLSAGKETRLVSDRPFVEISTMMNEENQHLLVHLVNYDVTIYGTITPARNIRVRLALPEGKTPGRLAYSGVLGNMVPIDYEVINEGRNTALEFVADTVNIYGLAILELE